MHKQGLRVLFVLVVISVLAVACGGAATPTVAPATSAPVPTAAVAATSVPAAAPTDAPQATEAGQPTDASVAPTGTTPTDAAPTTAAGASAPTTASASAGTLPASVGAGEGNVYDFEVVPDQTTVEYAVNEVLFGNKQITRGKTSTVEGDFKLGVKNGTPYFDFSKMRVDLRTLQSDNGMRDAALQHQWLDSSTYPYADYEVTSISGFPTEAKPGEDVKFQVTGNMTIHETTKPVTFDVTVKLDGDTLTGTGTTQLNMVDFGVTPPDILGRFKVTDPMTITVTGVAKYNPSPS